MLSNDLKEIVTGTDCDLFIGLKEAFSKPVPSHLFRFMEEKWAYEAIRDEKLSFGNVSMYDADDTEVEEYSRKCEKVFSEQSIREFMTLAGKNDGRFKKMEKDVS